MRGVTILDKDEREFLTFGLADLLRIAEFRAGECEWKVFDVECSELPAEHELYRAAGMHARLSGETLLRLVEDCGQIIDGRFEEYEIGHEKPWVIIRAVDSSAYDVETENDALISTIRRSFKNVIDF
jgi:hypothetical protein